MDDDSKMYAFLGIFLSVIGFIIVLLTKKKDKYAMFYAKQGLVLFIVAVIASIIMAVLAWIPILGWIIDIVLWIGLAILWVMGIIYSLSGKETDIPIIGMFARKISV